jgi:ERCC4-related helicase
MDWFSLGGGMEKIRDLWLDLLSRGMSMHGILECQHGGLSLVLTPYWDFMNLSDQRARREQLSASLDQKYSSFVASLGLLWGVHDEKFVVTLPWVTGGIPLPAPFALSLPRGELAAKRAELLFRKEPKLGSYSLRGRGVVADSFFSVVQTLCELEQCSPGGLTRSFHDLLNSLMDMYREVQDAVTRGDVVTLSAWEYGAISQFSFSEFYFEAPSLAQFRASVSGSSKSAFESSAHLCANLSFDRCWHWSNLLKYLGKKCKAHQKSDGLGLDYSAFVANLISIATAECAVDSAGELLADKDSAQKLFLARASDSGFRSFVALLLESRPHTPHVAWVVDQAPKSECDESQQLMLRLRPGMFLPMVHARSASQKRKGYERSDVIPWEDVLLPDEGNPLDLSEGVASSPGSRFWLVFDAIRALRIFPELFLNPTFLARGCLILSPEEVEQFRTRFQKGNCADKAEVYLACPHFLEQWNSLAASPILKPILAGVSNTSVKSRQWWDRDSTPGKSQGATYIQIDWLDWLSQSQVRLGVTWEFASDSPMRPLIDQVLKAMTSGSRVAPEVLSAISITNDFLFIPRPWFEVNGEEISFDDWSRAQRRGGTFVLPTGHSVAAKEYEVHTRRFVDRQKAYARMGKVSLGALWKSHVSVASKESVLSPAEYLGDLDMRLSPSLQALTEALEKRASEEAQNLKKMGLKADLREYQKRGVATLRARAAAGLNLCLADEMGLGKTIQTIAFILLVLNSDPKSQVLIVLPKSLLRNWRREFERFAPKLKVEEWGENGVSAQVILVTYSRVRIAVEKLSQKSFAAVVLDEAHTIKNFDTQVSQAVRRLSAKVRLALTGTPVENRAVELWNVMDWLNPGYLGKRHDFERFVSVARSFSDKMLMLKPLHAALQPVLLRRLKSSPDVALDLPDKIFEEHFYELTEEQSTLYEGILECTLGDPLGGERSIASRALYLKALMHLKQVCNHPALFLGGDAEGWLDEFVKDVGSEFSEEALRHLTKIADKLVQRRSKQLGFLDLQKERSGKMRAFLELLEKLRDEAAGVVIFTQFIGMGRILVETFQERDDAWWGQVPFLHGSQSAAERMQLVDEFQSACKVFERKKRGAPPVLVASLKAGGLGLNLTGADHVVHFDRWWNPAVEDQASDRLHRFGQKRTVTVHVFTGEQTLEESVAKVLEEKRLLAKDLLGLGAAAAKGVTEAAGSRDSFVKLVDPSGRYQK